MIFPTTVNGIPCQCEVTYFRPGARAQLLGPPEKCHPAEPDEFEFVLLDRRGRRATWLDRYITPQVANRIAEEHHIVIEGELYDLFEA